MPEASSPNAEFIDVWNRILVPKFLRFRDIMVRSLGAHGDVALRAHPPRPGERVLDVGCGFGDSSLQIARTVGPKGWVLGIDCCDAFLDVGRQDAERDGIDNVRFEIADAQTHPFEPTFDLCFSRFGTMFFQNPVAALRNMGRALRPGGRLLLVVWRTVDDNPWLGVPKAVVSELLPPPPEDGEQCGPGPFSMANQESVTDMLRAAGFEQIAFERVDMDVAVGSDVREAIDFQLEVGPAGEIVREAGALADAKRPLIEARLQSALGRALGDRGVVLGSSSWTIRARRPG